MSEELDVEQLVQNIEETGSQEGLPKEEGGKPDTSLSFGSLDDFMAHKLDYTANGKQVSEDIATILKRASAGYNYAQNMESFKATQAEQNEKIQRANQLDEKWSKFESHAEQNPEWYQHWNNAWENRYQQVGQQPTGDGGEIDARLTALLDQRLGPITEFMGQQKQQADAATIQAEDQKLDSQIKETRAANPSIDFDASDPDTGKTLQHAVIEFAIANEMKDFDAAFKVFYHDKLVAQKIENAKTDWAKEAKKNARNGIMGISDEPSSKKQSPASDFKGSTWDQVTEHAAGVLGFK